MDARRRAFLRMGTTAALIFFGPFRFARAWAAGGDALVDSAEKLAGNGPLDAAAVESLRAEVKRLVGAHGEVTPALQAAFRRIEEKSAFTPEGRAAFQTIVAETGGNLLGPIGVPVDNVPLWLKTPSALEGYRAAAQLPKEADYVVVGSGLTGSSAAHSLQPEIRNGKSVVMLEAGPRPAWGASGRNGGNIEAMKENFLTDYRGFVEAQKDFIKNRFPDLPESVLQREAERQSKVLLEFSRDNVKLVKKMVTEGKLPVDASFDGWLRIPTTDVEAKGLKEEIEFANKLGMKFELWSPEKIRQKTGIVTTFPGRFAKESGNFHPGKFVDEVMKNNVKNGVKLYTGTSVTGVTPLPDGTYSVLTKDGPIKARKVIFATNAYTPEILPGTGAIEPRVSHILNFQHVPQKMAGNYTVTTDSGDLYWNYPKGQQYLSHGKKFGTLHIGGGLDTPIPPAQLHNPPFMTDVYDHVRTRATEFTPIGKTQPPVRSWQGVMGFTEDRMPIISFYVDPNGVEHKGIVVAAGFNGYGGSQSVRAGDLAAELAVTGETPASMPDDVFSLKRFRTDKPLFPTTAPESCEPLFENLKS